MFSPQHVPNQLLAGCTKLNDHLRTKAASSTDFGIVTLYDKDRSPKKILVEGLDPTFAPQLSRQIPIICLFVKFPNFAKYRAIYLHDLSLNSFLGAILPFLPNSSNNPIYQDIYRVTKSGCCVIFDDAAVLNMKNEQDLILEIENIMNTNRYILKIIY
ncbi:hypothetical protein BB561_002192 [Smittium simulii]|uniref:GRHL1/CP2 C-terminal domain-containing protein n=1 Tax=Smittium simulii TaxID=133385 RepID=A0A2T9YRG9_9FUNG|nr:hypothetical protein BB561_002192 [Smittium simulii]